MRCGQNWKVKGSRMENEYTVEQRAEIAKKFMPAPQLETQVGAALKADAKLNVHAPAETGVVLEIHVPFCEVTVQVEPSTIVTVARSCLSIPFELVTTPPTKTGIGSD